MKKYSLEIKWGVLYTALMLLWMVFEKAMGWHDEKIDQHETMTSLFSIVTITIYVFALLEKRKSLGGLMSWKEGFISGLIISVVAAALSPIAQYITHYIITPDYFTNVIAYAVSSGKATQEQAESYFNFNSYLLQSVIGALLIGAVTAAIVALILKRK